MMTTREQLVRLDSMAMQSPDCALDLCRPYWTDASTGELKANPLAAHYFVTRFCYTKDEDRGGERHLIPDRPHVLRLIDKLEQARIQRKNLRIDKSRRMIVTLVFCAYHLWRAAFFKNYTALFVSWAADEVDDGGSSSTTNSSFGRIRYMVENLPEHVHVPAVFKQDLIRFTDTDSFIEGSAPVEDAGRSHGYIDVFIDEHAHVDFAEAIHESVDPACKTGKKYVSTFNGPDNLFAKMDEDETFSDWIFHSIDWKDDPTHTEGLRPTTPEERDRYGEFISPWFVRATASLKPEGIASQYNRSKHRSTVGIIHREYNFDKHVAAKGVIRYSPDHELRVGADIGHFRKFAAVAAQRIAGRMIVVGAFEGIARSLPENVRAMTEWLRDVVGYKGSLSRVVMVPDPSAFNEELGTGLEQYSYFRAGGYSSHASPRIVGADSVYLGNNVMKSLFERDMVTIAYEAAPLWRAISGYRLPIDPKTREIRSNKPVHNMASHPCDAFRYVGTSWWTADDIQGIGVVRHDETRAREVDQEIDSRHRAIHNGQGPRYVTHERPIMAGLPERF